jgi:peptidoglycan/xylan/chitin deacetylase (PgdA/CDA1 family)
MRIPRRLVKAAVFRLLEAAQLDRLLHCRIRRAGLVPILNFHRVSPQPNPYWTPIHPRHFDEIVSYLKRRFRILTLNELDDDPGPEPALVFSFDDGYYDFLEYAVPILERHGVRANQNVIPACALSGRPVWSVELADFLNASTLHAVRALRLPGFHARLEGDGFDEKVRYGLALSRFLKGRPRVEREQLWGDLARVVEASDFPRTRMLTTEEIRQLTASHEIGVHSYSHESMGLEGVDFFKEDLDRCFAFFAQHLQRPLTIYAFPNGSYRWELVDILKSRGLRRILVVDEHLARPRDGDGRVLPRLTMSPDSAREGVFQALDYRLRGAA